jgi:histidinol-phosphate aminotransferase
MAQVGALAALEDHEYYRFIVDMTRQGRAYLRAELESLGCSVYPSQANFLFINVRGEGLALYETLLRKGVIVRPMAAYGFTDCIRVTVGTEAENTRFLQEFSRCLKDLNYV